MANETKKTEEAGGGSKSMGKVVMIAAVIVVPLLLAAGTYVFFIGPMMSEPAAAVAHPPAAGGVTGDDTSDAIPQTAVTLAFEDDFVTVIMPDASVPASLLMFRMALVCLNPETADLVTKNKSHFAGLMNNIHSFKTRQELNDKLIKESMQKQVVKDSNVLLRRLADPSMKDGPELRILEAIHERFVVQDQL